MIIKAHIRKTRFGAVKVKQHTRTERNDTSKTVPREVVERVKEPFTLPSGTIKMNKNVHEDIKRQEKRDKKRISNPKIRRIIVYAGQKQIDDRFKHWRV